MKINKRDKVAGVILAAGASTRMGKPKQLLILGREHLLEHIITEALKSKLDSIILVLGYRFGDVKKSLKMISDNSRLEIIKNNDWERGISSSIITGVKAVADRFDHCMVILGDMPFVTSSVINDLLDRYIASGLDLGAIITKNRRSLPAIFSRSLYHELYNLKGDIGARSLFLKYPEKICFVESDNYYNDLDLDTPADLERYQEIIRSS